MKVFLLIFVIGISFVTVPAFAGYDPNYEIDGRLIYGIPLVCTVEFEDPDIPSPSIDKMLDATKKAISEWKGQLKNTERYLDDQKKWNIDYTLVRLTEKDDFDFSQCNVIIEFEAIPENPDYYLEYLGVAEPLGELRTKILIFYTDITTCVRKETDANYLYTYYDPCYSNKHMPFTQIGTTVRHEFGHALGLGHYVSDNPQKNDNWATGNSAAPSIMIVFAHDNPKYNPITVLDVETILQLYGKNGFLETEPKPESNSLMVEINPTFEKYTNKEFGFSINYPDTWYVDDTYFEPDTGGELFDMIHYPVDFFDTDDGWVSQFEVKYIENDKLVSEIQGSNYLDAFVDILKEDCILNSFDNVGFTCSNHSIIDSKIIQIDGKQAYQVGESYIETYPDQSYYETTRMIIDIPIGNNVWTLDSFTDSNEYPKFANTIQAMFDSFHIIQTGVNVSASSEKIVIPDWIRNNAKWWVEGTIMDSDFTAGIQYLIEEKIIQIPETVSSGEGDSQEIPAWIKNNADWWAQGLISDDDFVKGIQYLVEQGIIQV